MTMIILGKILRRRYCRIDNDNDNDNDISLAILGEDIAGLVECQLQEDGAEGDGDH